MNGFCFINKPAGCNSNDCIYQLRRQLGIRKIGHSGTLDPFANGLLIVAVGEATKYLPYIDHEPKAYRARLELGTATNTLDRDGEITEKTPVPALHPAEIEKKVQALKTLTEQVVPAFSAKRQNGKRLYDLARQGQTVPILKQKINVYESQLNAFIAPNIIDFSVTVSSGTYVRSLGETLAQSLGCVGHLSELTRLQIGERYHLADATVYDKTSPNPPALIPINTLLDHLPAIHLEHDKRVVIQNGGVVAVGHGTGIHRILSANETFLGIGEIRHGRLHPKRMLSPK